MLHPLLDLDRLRRIPPGVRLIEDPDAWLAARGDAYGEDGDSEGAGITRQHLELIYDVVIRKGLGRGMRVLDLGCGAGELAVELAGNVGEEGEVHGIDIARGQIERAERLAEEHGAGNTAFLVGSLSDGLPYETDSFDLVVSHVAFQLLPRKRRCLAEIHRVLKPGGLLALVTLCETSRARLVNAPEAWALVFDYVERNPEETEGRVRYPLGVFPTLDEMDGWLAELGFVDVDLAEHCPWHRLPPLFHRAYWSIWIDDDILGKVAAHAQAMADRLMPRMGVTEPRLEVFARKPLEGAERPPDPGRAWLSRASIQEEEDDDGTEPGD